jgi:hypothetical protein
MTFKLGDFFPRKAINEAFLSLEDPRWDELEGGYRRTLYNPAQSLKKLEKAQNIQEVDSIYKELWNELHHQGDVGIASYYALPHLVRIAKQTQLVDFNVLGMVSTIEIQRHKNNPKLPSKLLPNYEEAISELYNLAQVALKQNNNLDCIITALAAISLAKGHRNLADAISKFDSEYEIEAFLKNY